MNLQKGINGFDAYYNACWGERWKSLKSSLLDPVKKFDRKNAFFQAGSVEPIYQMDAASIYPAKALDVKPNDFVLDLCAAPGGKGLILLEDLAGTGQLTLNEISKTRREKLKRVLQQYVPNDERKNLRVTGYDGSKWCLHETEVYDKILVDAPCSGERHLLADAKEMKTWSQSRTKNLAKRQYALLSSALLVAKKGGLIVYSTCSISPNENDGVVERLVKKKKDEVQIISKTWDVGEKTVYGWQILPDKTEMGPIYFSVIKKVP